MSAINIPQLNVYDFKRIPVEDRLEVYADQMLLDARCSNIESAIISFVIENIEPIGWKAVWRKGCMMSLSSKRPRDVLVEVQDVSQCKLEATVHIIGPLQDDHGDHSDVDYDISDDANITTNVSLLELFPVYDLTTEEQFARTAEVIEHVRFFYTYLWYSWDAEDEDDCIFSKRYLGPRMKLYEDITNRVLSSQDVERYHYILNEARRLHQRLEVLEVEMGASDSDTDLDENDVMACMELRKKQEELKRQLLYMESPALRSLLMKKELSVKPLPLGRRTNGETVTHIVASRLVAGMCQKLPSNVIVMHHTAFASAIAAAHHGDTVQIYEGVYVCDSLGWLDDPIIIQGMSKSPEDVVLQANGDGGGDIFVNCVAFGLHISNLTIRNVGDRQYVLMVHGGHTVLERCHVQFGDSSVGISVRPTAELTLKECRLGPAIGCAIDVQLSGNVIESGVQFEDCLVRVARQCDESQKKNICTLHLPNEDCDCVHIEDRNLWYRSDRDIHQVIRTIITDKAI